MYRNGASATKAKTPMVLLPALQNVSLDDYALMLKGTLENGGNFGIGN